MIACTENLDSKPGHLNKVIFYVGFICISGAIFDRASAAELDFPVKELTVAEQNEMMRNFCVMCHLDSSMNGGLSLEHFDAATVSPPLAAMLANKFTTGVPLNEILQPTKDASVLSKLEAGKRAGAPSVMGVAGLPLPSDDEINGFIMAMAEKAEGFEQWHIKQEGDLITADVIRLTPVPQEAGRRDINYRLKVTCNIDSNEGEILLSWSPMPRKGELKAIVDGNLQFEYVLDHEEPMANGDPGASAPSSVVLAGAAKIEKHSELPLPMNTLEFSGLFPLDPVEFSFSDLRELNSTQLFTCFD